MRHCWWKGLPYERRLYAGKQDISTQGGRHWRWFCRDGGGSRFTDSDAEVTLVLPHG